MLLSLSLPLLRKNEIEYYGNKNDKGDGKVKSALEKLPDGFAFFRRLTTDSCLICFLFHIYSFTLSNEEMASRAKNFSPMSTMPLRRPSNLLGRPCSSWAWT